MTRRWRPPLALVLAGALLGTLGLSYAGLVALRYLGPEIGFRNAAMILGALILLATGVLGWLLWRLLLRPMLALQAYAVGVRDGAGQPPRHFGTAELHRTAASVIDMAEALRDRAATIRSYTDHVTHELKTPVSVIRAAVELLQDGGTLDATLLAQIDGARAQIEDQLAALRQAAQAREARHLGQVTLADLADDLRVRFPDLDLRIAGDAPLPLSRDGLLIVLGHLLQNAQQHGARRVDLTARDGELVVSDDGCGITPGNAPRIFDPFFTTRRDDRGTGMGLTIVRNLLQAHRADIGLLPAQAGAVFRISFDRLA